MPAKEENRRRFPRVAYPCLLKFFSETQGQEILLTHTENISAGGCHVIVKKNVKQLSPVAVEIDFLDQGEHLVIDGQVAWVVKRKDNAAPEPAFFELGIEFKQMSEKNQKRLEAAIAKIIKKGYRPLKTIY